MARAGAFKVRRGGITALVQGPAGRRDLIRRADAVVARAKIFAPVRHGGLRNSVARGEPRSTKSGLACTVGATVRYAAAIHEGRGSRYAPPSWRNRGPGPRRFLTNALPAAGGRITRRGR